MGRVEAVDADDSGSEPGSLIERCAPDRAQADDDDVRFFHHGLHDSNHES